MNRGPEIPKSEARLQSKIIVPATISGFLRANLPFFPVEVIVVVVVVLVVVVVVVVIVVVIVVVVVVVAGAPPYQLCWLIFPLPELWGEGGGGGEGADNCV